MRINQKWWQEQLTTMTDQELRNNLNQINDWDFEQAAQLVTEVLKRLMDKSLKQQEDHK